MLIYFFRLRFWSEIIKKFTPYQNMATVLRTAYMVVATYCLAMWLHVVFVLCHIFNTRHIRFLSYIHLSYWTCFILLREKARYSQHFHTRQSYRIVISILCKLLCVCTSAINNQRWALPIEVPIFRYFNIPIVQYRTKK